MSITAKSGDRVFVTDPNNRSEFYGAHGTVIAVDASADSEMPIMVLFTRQDGTIHRTWIHRGTFNVTEEEAPATPVEPAIITDLQAQIDTLTLEATTQTNLHIDTKERLAESQRRYSADMRSIERIMLETKEQQSWCDNGWNEVVDEVNEALIGGYEFDRIKRRKRMTKRVRGTVYRDVEVWVGDDDDTDDDDADNWYQSEDGDDQFGELADILNNEYENNGFDDIEVEDR